MRTLALALVILAIAAAASTYAADQCIPAKRIAVMNLKVSGEYSEQVKDWLPALIEDRLLNEGWTLVVRGQRMEHIQQERNLEGVKPVTKLPDNEILGATAFVELAARVQVKDIQGIIGYKGFAVGDYARASVDVTGQIVDPATGVLKASVKVGGSASGLKTAGAVSIGSDWKIGAGGYNLKGVRESLVGKAADTAAARLVEKLKALYPSIPGDRNTPAVPTSAIQPASTTIPVASLPTILIELPDSSAAAVGDRFGVYRGENLIAELEIVKVFGKRAEAKILSQTSAIAPTDVARKLIVLKTGG